MQERRYQLFKNTKANIVRLLDNLERSPNTSIEKEIVLEEEDSFLLSSDNMKALKRYKLIDNRSDVDMTLWYHYFKCTIKLFYLTSTRFTNPERQAVRDISASYFAYNKRIIYSNSCFTDIMMSYRRPRKKTLLWQAD